MLESIINPIFDYLLLIVGIVLFIIGAKVHNKNTNTQKIYKGMTVEEANNVSKSSAMTTLGGLVIFIGLAFTLFALAGIFK